MSFQASVELERVSPSPETGTLARLLSNEMHYRFPPFCWVMFALVGRGLVYIWWFWPVLLEVVLSPVELKTPTLQAFPLIPGFSYVYQATDPIVFHACLNHAIHEACAMKYPYYINCNNQLLTDFYKIYVGNFLQCPETFYKESLSVFQRERKNEILIYTISPF